MVPDETLIWSLVSADMRPAFLPTAGKFDVFRNETSGVQHLARHGDGKFLCGRPLSKRYTRYHGNLVIGVAVCDTCSNHKELPPWPEPSRGLIARIVVLKKVRTPLLRMSSCTVTVGTPLFDLSVADVAIRGADTHLMFGQCAFPCFLAMCQCVFLVISSPCSGQCDFSLEMCPWLQHVQCLPEFQVHGFFNHFKHFNTMSFLMFSQAQLHVTSSYRISHCSHGRLC